MFPREVLVPEFVYKGFRVGFSEMFDCWVIMDQAGEPVREPYWGTTAEVREAIDSGEAL